MKKLAFIVVLICSMFNVVAQTDTTCNVVRVGNTFVKQTKERKAVTVELTGFNYQVGEQVYPVYINSNGSCFIVRTSKKTGKEYKQYLPKEVQEEIRKELGVSKQ